CEQFIGSVKVVTSQAMDVVPDPVLIVEVLSPGTQYWDRGGKWQAYQTIPTLAAYLLVSQDEPRVERYARERDGWSYHVFAGLERTVTVAQPAVSLRLSDIYERIDVPSIPGSRL